MRPKRCTVVVLSSRIDNFILELKNIKNDKQGKKQEQ